MARVLLALFAFGIMLVAAAAEADADRKLLAPAPKPKVTNVPKVIAAAPKGMHKAGTGQAQAVQAATSDAINKAVTSQGRRLSSAYAPAPKPKGTNVPKVIAAAPKGMKSGGTGQAQAVQARTSAAINKAVDNAGRRLSSAYAPAPKPKGTNVPKVISAAPKGMKTGGTGQAQAVQARTSDAINKAVDKAGRRL